jgi:stage V sporulation protein B
MAKKDFKNVRSAARTGLKLAFIIGTPCAVGMFVLAAPIIRMLYGSSMSESQITLAAELMQTACVGVVFLSLVQTLTGVIQGLGKPNVPVLNLLFGGVLKVVTIFILMRIPEINIQGAAVSTVVCYAAAGVLNMIYLIRKTNMRLSVPDVFLKPILSAVFMGVVVHYLYRLLSVYVSVTISTLASVGIGVLLYLAAVLFLRMFSAEDLRFLPGGSKLKRFARKEQ